MEGIVGNILLVYSEILFYADISIFSRAFYTALFPMSDK
jgi:hypothetical protein